MVPYYASCGAYKMLPDEAPLLYVLRQHCHVAVKIYLSCNQYQGIILTFPF